MKNSSCLIVDDNKSVQSVLKEILTDCGKFKSVVSAFDGADALKKMANQEFDVVVLDINMPRMGGIELLSELKKNKLLKPDSYLVISGNLDSENVKAAVTMGVKNFLVKPFSNDEFVEKVLTLVK